MEKAMRPIRELSPIAALVREAGSLAYDGAESSFKLSAGSLQENRILYGFRKENFSVKLAREWAVRLGMPEIYLQMMNQNFAAANYIYLGAEEDSVCTKWKWYFEFPVFTGSNQIGRPVLMYLGWKWNAQNGAPIAVTHYHWRVAMPLPGMYAAIQEICGEDHPVLLSSAFKVLELASRRVNAEKLIFLHVNEQNSPRQSFDLNVYASGLTVGDTEGLLQTIASQMTIPKSAFNKLLLRIKRQPLGHLAGGIDRARNLFITVYYEIND
ncbi:MAG: hypothetical protein HQM06_17520 [Magnetococcales bacterium]|nr:hypothetical protein [Magnetococcales bacterium]